MVVAGEASGDAHAAELIGELRRRRPELRFFGCGGEAMAEAGCELLVQDRELAVMGLAEVVRHLPRLHGLLGKLKRALRERRPRGVILVDFPDFNLRLAAYTKKLGIPVAYFISPQLWAWRSGRVEQIRRNVTKMICIFPFEQGFYARHGIEVASVGHPLVERIPQPGAGGDAVVLLPGSRQREVDYHLPVLIEAVKRMPGRRFVLPAAPHVDTGALRARVPAEVEVLAPGNMYAALAQARVALAGSGTATLETALMGVPMVVYYRLSPISYWIGRRLVRTPHVAIVNLIAEREVVPELIQNEFTPERVVAAAEPLLEDGPERTAMLQGLAEVRARLGPGGAIARAAEAVAATFGLG